MAKFSNYPALNVRSDLFFVICREAERIDCSKLSELTTEVYFSKDYLGKIINVNHTKRDEIVKQVLHELKKEQCIFKMSLEDYTLLCDLCQLYIVLIGENKVQTDVWNYVYDLLMHVDFYKTSARSQAAAQEKIQLLWNVK